jgi:hypothetical protein
MFELSDNEKRAYEWALNQQFTSVAAEYAKLLATALKRLMEANKDSQ